MTARSMPSAIGLPTRVGACLFDLDGVLTQTATVHAKAWGEMFDAFLRGRVPGGTTAAPFTQADYNAYVDGKPRADGVRDFLRSRGIELPEGSADDPPEADTVQGLGTRKNAVVQGVIARDGVQAYPGSVEYLRAVRAAGLPTAVVSASANCEQVVRAAGLEQYLDHRIDGVIAARERLNGKPAPDTFLAGAEAIGIEPASAAVFEDAIAGVRAAAAGGFGWVVGVDRVDHAAELRAGGADQVVGDLAELLPER
jgi:beta-phosphoglucomutase family hydrolase